jgi:hypothetical protein
MLRRNAREVRHHLRDESGLRVNERFWRRVQLVSAKRLFDKFAMSAECLPATDSCTAADSAAIRSFCRLGRAARARLDPKRLGAFKI